jgi:hypothetical protein
MTIWHDLHWFDDEADQDSIRAYLADSSVQKEIRTAYARSVASGDHRPSQWSYVLLNQAAAIFFGIGEKALAADALRRIGDRPLSTAWEYLGDPAKQFAKAKKWVAG